MSSDRRKGYRKLSRGNLKSRTHDTDADHRDRHGVKIYVKTHHNDGALPPEVDEEQFEHLKDMYYKQCHPINMNLIRKLTDKRNTSNYNYYDSAQYSAVGSQVDTVSGAAHGSRDAPAKYYDRNSDNKRYENEDGGCSKCHRRHY